MKEVTKDWDVNAMATAVVADDPDAIAIHGELIEALNDMKAGRYAKAFEVELSPIAETRHKTGLSQRLFAERLGISVNTLKSWEQGKRQPSGSASALIKLITKRPELIAELA
ncbi:helix-turn-helix domain-containing protein [Muribacter muris]|uniref:Helix-turn-helix domain-containing protein n=2 Tax=Muribacter muris TaxID=67855 RepID=A0A4Y9JYI8_9PAST|nr:type II toxin-antitoxin system MqsA family antitoxin [Muribacter muris]MBF0826770.1 type II toxin-antitoxin system MqsA family antitoxin [Muribacter muris]TFV10322.1 helix-turn-helix domain-containing protein [Muribacter muris]